jgi:hypothetical protein
MLCVFAPAVRCNVFGVGVATTHWSCQRLRGRDTVEILKLLHAARDHIMPVTQQLYICLQPPSSVLNRLMKKTLVFIKHCPFPLHASRAANT